MLKNDTLKNGTSRIGLYAPGQLVHELLDTFNNTPTDTYRTLDHSNDRLPARQFYMKFGNYLFRVCIGWYSYCCIMCSTLRDMFYETFCWNHFSKSFSASEIKLYIPRHFFVQCKNASRLLFKL